MGNTEITATTENMTDEQQFKAAYDEIAYKDSGYARIYAVREKLGWDREKFDNMLITLRDKGVLQLIFGGDISSFTEENIHDSFIDENGIYKIGMMWRAAI